MLLKNTWSITTKPRRAAMSTGKETTKDVSKFFETSLASGFNHLVIRKSLHTLLADTTKKVIHQVFIFCLLCKLLLTNL